MESELALLAEDGVIRKDYPALLSIHQACVYKGLSFFRFLLSQKRELICFMRLA